MNMGDADDHHDNSEACYLDTLGESEVRYADVATVVDEHVLRLEVSEHDIEVVQVLEGKARLRTEEPRLLHDTHDSCMR